MASRSRMAIPRLLFAAAAALVFPCHSTAKDNGLSADEQSLLRQRADTGNSQTLSVDSPDGHGLLEHPSRPIAPDTPELPALIADMDRTVKAQHGAGLAAVQIGIPVRVALLRRADSGEFEAFLNPERIEASAEQTGAWERCLSVPWGYRYTERPVRITVRYQTLEGDNRSKTLTGDEAVVFQQELDHLDGKLLSGDHDHRWFIPEDKMTAFISGLNQQCPDLARADCRALAKSRWEAWAALAH